MAICAAPMLACGIRVATSLLADMGSLSRREGVTRSWMNCPLDKSATSAKPWRSQTSGFALDMGQAQCVRRDPHLPIGGHFIPRPAPNIQLAASATPGVLMHHKFPYGWSL